MTFVQGDAGIVPNAKEIVSFYLHIQQQSKLKTGFIIGENSVFALRNKMQWTTTRSEALSHNAPRAGIEDRVGTCGIVHIVTAENLLGVWRSGLSLDSLIDLT